MQGFTTEKDMKIQGPIEVELKVSVTNGEGVQGVATIGLGKGCYPNALAQADAACGVSPGAMGSAAHYGGRNETD
jgi:hypothetical protein